MVQNVLIWKPLQDTNKAVKTSAVVDGIKGPSWFAGLSSYDIIKGTAIDYMYGLCLSVMKTMNSGFLQKTPSHVASVNWSQKLTKDCFKSTLLKSGGLQGLLSITGSTGRPLS